MNGAARLRKRPDGCGVVADRAADAIRKPNRPAAQDGPARGCECSSLPGLGGLRMAALAKGFPAVLDGAEILLALARRRIVARHQQRTRHGGARTGRPGSQPVGRRHRQPIGQDYRERRNPGFDAGKKIMGRKRHIVVDTLGLLVGVVVHAADIQDRDGAPAVLRSILKRWPWLRHVFADGGYAGPKLRGALQKIGSFTLEIIKRSDSTKGFEVLPRRWVVERTFAWLGRCRRLAKDFERSIESAQAWVFIASIRLLTRRLARA